MSEQLAVQLLFAASAAVAAIAAFADRWLAKVNKVALAVALAASAFLLRVTDWLS